MGLFDRFRSRASVQGTAARRATLFVPHTWLQAPAFRAAGYLVDVVGEASYQDALEAVCSGRTSEGAACPLVTAVLVREPSNRYDRNAVRVDVGGRTVAYLPRGDAPVFHGLLDRVAALGRVPTCRAWLTGGWYRGALDTGHFGLRLDLHPDLQVVDNAPLLPFGNARVSVTGEEHAQAYLSELLDGADRVELVATVEVDGDRLAVTIGDELVGSLTAKMSDRYQPWVAQVVGAGFEATAEARVVRGANKIEAYLKLARPWAETQRRSRKEPAARLR